MYVGDRGEDTPRLRRMFGTNRYGFQKGSSIAAGSCGEGDRAGAM